MVFVYPYLLLLHGFLSSLYLHFSTPYIVIYQRLYYMVHTSTRPHVWYTSQDTKIDCSRCIHFSLHASRTHLIFQCFCSGFYFGTVGYRSTAHYNMIVSSSKIFLLRQRSQSKIISCIHAPCSQM